MNNSISLTASELGYLWTGYSINEMSKWYLKVFMEHARDEEIKDLYSFALENTKKMLTGRKNILSNENYPIPIGFSENDIEINSSPLFSDRFLLYYLHVATHLGLEFHSRALSVSARADVRKYNIDCLDSAIQLNEKVINLLLNKGLFWRPPTLPPPIVPEKIQKKSYLKGWLGDNRPLNSIEIANHYLLLDLLIIMETLFTGFEQTSNSEDVVKLLSEGITTVKNQYNVLAKLLDKDELPIPPCYSADVTDNRNRIFSNQIILSHTAGLYGSLLSQFGFAIGSVMRHDLVAAYSMLVSEAGIFTEKVTKFLIDKGWLEKVPGAFER